MNHTSTINGRRLRIAQIAPPFVPTPPHGMGGTEWVAGNLTDELVRLGHEVVLFAHPESRTAAELVSFPELYGVRSMDRLEFAHTARAMESAGSFDIVHNHCLLGGPALGHLVGTPTLTTLHHLQPIIHAFPRHSYVAISRRQRELVPDLNVVSVVYNGVNCAAFPFVESKSDYLLFLGAMDPKKGPDLAIEVARRLGARLLIAGPEPIEMHRAFFEERIRPALDGRIEYVGEACGERKLQLLANARCLLCPARWEEPFGLVAAEAMACGTPVIAAGRGALPEVVADGVSGFVVNSVEEMAAAVERLDAIAPKDCREWVEARFDAGRMAAGYLSVYRRMLEPAAGRRAVAIAPRSYAAQGSVR